MAKNGFKVLDSDLHVIEPADLWQRYIDPTYRSIAPIGLARRPRDMLVTIHGESTSHDLGSRSQLAHEAKWERERSLFSFAEERGWDAVSQLQAMDQEGIDVAVLFGSRALFVLGLDSTETAGEKGLSPPFAAAIARAYNDWLHDFCSVAPNRLFGVAMVAPHDVESAVAETRRCVERYGFRGIFLMPGRVNKRPWHHPYYDPLWAECERLNIPVCFHGGGPTFLTPDFGFELYDALSLWHTFSHSLGPMYALVCFTGGGVLERFPKLRAAFLEGNCSWAPWLLYRMDSHFDWTGHIEIPLPMKPSEYFKRSCFVSLEADEEPIRLYVDALGDENVVFSTDYPHPDAKFPHAVESLLKLPLSKNAQRKILWDNCARLYDVHSPVREPAQGRRVTPVGIRNNVSQP